MLIDTLCLQSKLKTMIDNNHPVQGNNNHPLTLCFFHIFKATLVWGGYFIEIQFELILGHPIFDHDHNQADDQTDDRLSSAG